MPDYYGGVIRIDFTRVIQNVLVVGARILAAEISSPARPPPKPIEPEGLTKETVHVSLYLKDTERVVKSGLPAGSLVSPVKQFIPEHAEHNQQVIASTSATVKRLRERLAEELYRMQMDLEDGAHIGGIPCDCLDGKHKLGLRATAKELLSMDTNPVPQEVLGWLVKHEMELNPQAIRHYGPDHYKALAGDMREFRKRLGE